MNKSYHLGIVAIIAGLWGFSLSAQDGPGTLIFDVKPFTSEIKLKEKIESRLKSGGIEWGVADGQLVVTMVNKRFVRFDIPHFTRYGESKSLELAPGSYRITCIGFIPEGGFSVEKALSKGAYFNLDLRTLQVVAGKTTTLEIHPKIQKESTFLLKWYTPDLLVKIIEDGVAKDELVINGRADTSLAWDAYTGPLKFEVQPSP